MITWIRNNILLRRPKGGAAEGGQPMNPEPQVPPAPEWLVDGVSVRGASHVRAKIDNQDAVSFNKPNPPDFLPVVLAVADGHGGSKYFRSHIGARRAVEVATRYIEEFVMSGSAMVDNAAGFSELTLVKRAAEETVPQKLVNEWAKEVRRDLKGIDFKRPETARLSDKERDAFYQEMDKYQNLPWVDPDEMPPEDQAEREKWEHVWKERQECEAKLFQAYGATLLAVAVMKDYVIYWQLGDGDILTVSSDGQVERVMPKDERLIANETTSLCTANARREFRVEFKPLPEDPRARPALIMLSTDGYSNSYSSQRGFERVASDLLEMISEEGGGFETVMKQLPSWLQRTSEGGSGDDISVGLILRRSAVEEAREAKHRRKEECLLLETAAAAEAEIRQPGEASTRDASGGEHGVGSGATLSPEAEAGDREGYRGVDVNVRAGEPPGAGGDGN